MEGWCDLGIFLESLSHIESLWAQINIYNLSISPEDKYLINSCGPFLNENIEYIIDVDYDNHSDSSED